MRKQEIVPPILLYEIARNNSTVLVDNSMLVRILSIDKKIPFSSPNFPLEKNISDFHQYYDHLFHFFIDNKNIFVTRKVYSDEFLKHKLKLEEKFSQLIAISGNNNLLLQKSREIESLCISLNGILRRRIITPNNKEKVKLLYHLTHEQRKKISYIDAEMYITAGDLNAGIITRDMDFQFLHNYSKTDDKNIQFSNLPQIYVPSDFNNTHLHRYIKLN